MYRLKSIIYYNELNITEPCSHILGYLIYAKFSEDVGIFFKKELGFLYVWKKVF